MAQKVTVSILDDLDGSEAAETIEFGLDGVEYTIDLSAENSTQLRDRLRPFVESARRAQRDGRDGRSSKPKTRRRTEAGVPGEQALARIWAKNNGIEVRAIGRLSADVVERYRAAQG